MLSLSTALISFLAFGIVSFINMKEVYDKALVSGRNMGDSTAKFTEQFAVEQAKKRLFALALEKSRRMERGMIEVKSEAESIAMQMSQILSYPENYKPIRLPLPTEKPICSGEAYVHYAPGVDRKSVIHEVDIASNIDDMLKVISNFYEGHNTSSYIGSKNGYLICIDTLINKEGNVVFTKEFNETYDPRERIWYKAAEKDQKTVVTDCYLGADGYLAVTCATPFYDSEGFAGVAGVSTSLEALSQLVTEDILGNTNINFALSNKGEVVLSSAKTGTFAVTEDNKDLRNSVDKIFAKEVVKMTEGKSNVSLVSVDGKEYYIAYASMPTIGWSFGSLIERDEVIQPANVAKEMIIAQSKKFVSTMNSFYMKHVRNILLSLVGIFVLLFWISVVDSKRFVTPIISLTSGVREIAKGNLDKKLDIKSGDEIEMLADSVNNMTSELKQYMENLSKITADKERIATELNVAKNIQAGMLPSVENSFSDKKEFCLSATMTPAKEVGGDFYDFYMLDEKHLAITVADVSGKGVGAALFMVISKTVLKNFALMAASAYSEGREPDLALIMEQANRQLCENNKENMFVTVFMGILDITTGEFAYVNAGHNPPLIRHINEGEFSYIRNVKKNRIIGVSRNSKYLQYRLTLFPGDMLFLYTDGVTEAMNEQKELFNENRLKSTLDTVSVGRDSNEMVLAVQKAVKKHSGDSEQSDDMTMLGLVYKSEEII